MTIKLISLKPSTRDNKKYMAKFEIQENDKTRTKTTHFGAKGASDYIKHKDQERRERYLDRHRKDLDTNDPTRAGYLSYFILWGVSTDIRDNVSDYLDRLKEYNKTGYFPISI